MSSTATLGYVIHYVQDVNKTLLFYKNAFGFEIRFMSPDEDYGELITGSTTLAFAQHQLAASNLNQAYVATNIQSPPPGIEIGVVCQDVESFVQRALEHGATLETAAKTKPWGQVVAYVRDPDGLLVEICSPME